MPNYNEEKLPIKQILKYAGVALLAIFLLTAIAKSVVNVDAGEICIVQDPLGGLHCYTTPGPHPQYWGSSTNYKKSFQYDFTSAKYTKDESSGEVDRSIKVRFNDNGHAQFSGSVRIDLPLDDKSMLNLHTRFRSQRSLENDLIDKVITKAVYFSGPLMSSKESYAEKRNNLINYISDQAEHGVFKTYQAEVKVKDPFTNEEKVQTVVKYEKDSVGGFVRQEGSPLEEAHIGFSNLSILGMDYEEAVEKQSKDQQALTMAVQTAIANSKKAEQDAITIEFQGKAKAAQAKWDQEVIKATATTEAQQELEVARLAAQTEAQNKLALTLKGEGEANYKRAVTQANNNLELRLNAAIEINKNYAAAMASSNWVPTYIGGSGAGGASNGGALDLIHLMTANAAREAGLVPDGEGKKK